MNGIMALAPAATIHKGLTEWQTQRDNEIEAQRG
jgi:hypothetical protein